MLYTLQVVLVSLVIHQDRQKVWAQGLLDSDEKI